MKIIMAILATTILLSSCVAIKPQYGCSGNVNHQHNQKFKLKHSN